MDFDDLKRVWDNCDHELESSIQLNARQLLSLLKLNRNGSVNRLEPGGIDYTLPVVLARKQFHANWIVRIARDPATWIEGFCRVGEGVAMLHTTIMRVLRRHRTLRG